MPVAHVAPALAMTLGAVVCLLVALSVPRRGQWLGAPLAVVTAAVAAALAADLHRTLPAQRTFSGTWALDGLTAWATWTICGATALVAMLSPCWLSTDRRHGEWYALLLFSALGAILLAGAADVMELMVAMLLVSVTGSVLASYHRQSCMSAEAGAKYFFLGALTNPLLLLGIVLLYGLAGTTRYAGIAGALAGNGADPVVITAAVGLVLVGLAFELGAVPAHPWVPDVAQASPAPAAAFLTVVPKLGALAALARFALLLPDGGVPWRPLVALMSVATMTLGNLAALGQRDVRRLLGWSSVSQIGYGLMAVVALERSALARPALVTFLVAYGLANLAAFGVVISLRGRTRLQDYRGLAGLRPWHTAALILALLSLAGIPPLIGFTAKLALFGAAIDAGYAWLAVAAVINTVISVFYYLRVIVPMMLRAPVGTAPVDAKPVATLGHATAAVGLIVALSTLVAGVLAEPLLASSISIL